MSNGLRFDIVRVYCIRLQWENMQDARLSQEQINHKATLFHAYKIISDFEHEFTIWSSSNKNDDNVQSNKPPSHQHNDITVNSSNKDKHFKEQNMNIQIFPGPRIHFPISNCNHLDAGQIQVCF